MSLAITAAAKEGNLSKVKELIDAGEDIHTNDKYGWTAFRCASRYGHIEIVQLLLERGADVMDRGRNGGTALHWATRNGHIETVKLLLDRGADIKAKDKFGSTALHKAALYGHIDTAQLLLDRGADVMAKDNNGKNALDFATDGKKREVAALLRSAEERRNEAAAEQLRKEEAAIALKRVADEEAAAASPFDGLCYDELMKNLRLLSQELTASLNVHDVDKCALLQVQIKDLNKMLKKSGIPQRDCCSRGDVEINILELQFAMESCGINDPDLTLRYESMNSVYKELRSNFPTATELKQRIALAKEELQSAISTKQFRKCGELKGAIAAFEEQLTVLSSDKVVQFNQILSVAEVRRIFVSLETKINEAIAAQQFEVCEEIQEELDFVEGVLKRRDLSEAARNSRLKQLKVQLEESRELCDFNMMAELQLEIENIQLETNDNANALQPTIRDNVIDSRSGMLPIPPETHQMLLPRDSIKKEHIIGKGGFGCVYKGCFARMDVALKVFEGAILHGHVLESIKRECALLQKLQHENIVRFYGLMVEPNEAIIVMQLGAQGSLYAFLHSSEDIPWSMRLRVADELSRGLAYLHDHNVVHRDIKSLNVVLDRDYHAMWCDFGLATLKLQTSTTTAARTVQDKVIGTTRWLAPELFAISSCKPSFASDMWSFGMVLYEIAVRKLPFADVTIDAQLIALIMAGTGERIPDEVNKECPSLCEVMRGCWCPVANRSNAGTVADRMKSIFNATKLQHQPIREEAAPSVASLNIHTPSYSPWT